MAKAPRKKKKKVEKKAAVESIDLPDTEVFDDTGVYGDTGLQPNPTEEVATGPLSAEPPEPPYADTEAKGPLNEEPVEPELTAQAAEDFPPPAEEAQEPNAYQSGTNSFVDHLKIVDRIGPVNVATFRSAAGLGSDASTILLTYEAQGLVESKFVDSAYRFSLTDAGKTAIQG